MTQWQLLTVALTAETSVNAQHWISAFITVNLVSLKCFMSHV
jgi:hypothetical protein